MKDNVVLFTSSCPEEVLWSFPYELIDNARRKVNYVLGMIDAASILLCNRDYVIVLNVDTDLVEYSERGDGELFDLFLA